jgi:hypothetical protein
MSFVKIRSILLGGVNEILPYSLHVSFDLGTVRHKKNLHAMYSAIRSFVKLGALEVIIHLQV